MIDNVYPLQLPDDIPSVPWLDLPAGVRDIAERLNQIIEEQRQQEGQAPSVRDEELLLETSADLVYRIIDSPSGYGIPPTTQQRLRSDDEFRDTLIHATRVRASRLWPLSRLLYLAPGLEELHCFRWDRWVLTTAGHKMALSLEGNPFRGDDEVVAFFRDKVLGLLGLVGSHQLNDGNPIAEATVGGLMRMIVAIRPAVSGDGGIQATIRMPSAFTLRTLDDYVRSGTMTPGVAQFLTACVNGRANILIAGGTATGKTTLMRVLAGMIPNQETVVVIEDSAELHLEADRGDGQFDPATNQYRPRPWVPLSINLCTVQGVLRQEAGITMRELVRAALRFRPDRILLGESRGAEMADVCTAMSTGHDGSMVTIHADSAFMALERAANYIMESPRFASNSNSYELAKRAVHQALDVVVHLAHSPGGARRISGVVALGENVDHTAEVYGLTQEGTIRRTTTMLADLPPRLRLRIQPHLPTTQIPPA
ncbi:MAG: ATPase, T2SS/T4P/T4SS family [Candidatus Dormibacteraceae bacterium]